MRKKLKVRVLTVIFAGIFLFSVQPQGYPLDASATGRNTFEPIWPKFDDALSDTDWEGLGLSIAIGAAGGAVGYGVGQGAAAAGNATVQGISGVSNMTMATATGWTYAAGVAAQVGVGAAGMGFWGGISAEIQGGNFEDGFLAGAVSGGITQGVNIGLGGAINNNLARGFVGAGIGGLSGAGIGYLMDGEQGMIRYGISGATTGFGAGYGAGSSDDSTLESTPEVEGKYTLGAKKFDFMKGDNDFGFEYYDSDMEFSLSTDSTPEFTSGVGGKYDLLSTDSTPEFTSGVEYGLGAEKFGFMEGNNGFGSGYPGSDGEFSLSTTQFNSSPTSPKLTYTLAETPYDLSISSKFQTEPKTIFDKVILKASFGFATTSMARTAGLAVQYDYQDKMRDTIIQARQEDWSDEKLEGELDDLQDESIVWTNIAQYSTAGFMTSFAAMAEGSVFNKGQEPVGPGKAFANLGKGAFVGGLSGLGAGLAYTSIDYKEKPKLAQFYSEAAGMATGTLGQTLVTEVPAVIGDLFSGKKGDGFVETTKPSDINEITMTKKSQKVSFNENGGNGWQSSEGDFEKGVITLVSPDDVVYRYSSAEKKWEAKVPEGAIGSISWKTAEGIAVVANDHAEIVRIGDEKGRVTYHTAAVNKKGDVIYSPTSSGGETYRLSKDTGEYQKQMVDIQSASKPNKVIASLPLNEFNESFSLNEFADSYRWSGSTSVGNVAPKGSMGLTDIFVDFGQRLFTPANISTLTSSGVDYAAGKYLSRNTNWSKSVVDEVSSSLGDVSSVIVNTSFTSAIAWGEPLGYMNPIAKEKHLRKMKKVEAIGEAQKSSGEVKTEIGEKSKVLSSALWGDILSSIATRTLPSIVFTAMDSALKNNTTLDSSSRAYLIGGIIAPAVFGIAAGYNPIFSRYEPVEDITKDDWKSVGPLEGAIVSIGGAQADAVIRMAGFGFPGTNPSISAFNNYAGSVTGILPKPYLPLFVVSSSEEKAKAEEDRKWYKSQYVNNIYKNLGETYIANTFAVSENFAKTFNVQGTYLTEIVRPAITIEKHWVYAETGAVVDDKDLNYEKLKFAKLKESGAIKEKFKHEAKLKDLGINTDVSTQEVLHQLYVKLSTVQQRDFMQGDRELSIGGVKLAETDKTGYFIIHTYPDAGISERTVEYPFNIQFPKPLTGIEPPYFYKHPSAKSEAVNLPQVPFSSL